jgi:hypothetical protein
VGTGFSGHALKARKASRKQESRQADAVLAPNEKYRKQPHAT